MSRSFWLEGWGSLGLAVLLALVVRWLFIEAYVVPGHSMAPTLLTHDHIFVNKLAYGTRLPFSEKWLWKTAEPQRGEVIVFKGPFDRKQLFSKRVIGVPGDRVLIEDGELYINEKLVEKRVPTELSLNLESLGEKDFPSGSSAYVLWEERLGAVAHGVLVKKRRTQKLTLGPFWVPEGHFFVMGDHRDHSLDSRFWNASSKAASGTVEFKRLNPKDSEALVIPEGTVVLSKADEGVPGRKFQTVESVQMTGASARVRVLAQFSGISGNIAAEEIVGFSDSKFTSRLRVSNPEPFSGGFDQRFVPRSHILGRSGFVWLSCEEMLPYVSFLCNPGSVRWGRFFHSIK